MAASLLSKIFFAFTVLKHEWSWAKVSSKVGFCLLNNFLFSSDSVRTLNTLRPHPSSGTCMYTCAQLCLPQPGLGSRPGAHGAYLQRSLLPALRLLLTWPLHVSWTWFAIHLGLWMVATSPQCCSPSLCGAALRLVSEGTACALVPLGSQLGPPSCSCSLTVSILRNYTQILK